MFYYLIIIKKMRKLTLKEALELMRNIHDYTGYDVYFSGKGDGTVQVIVQDNSYYLDTINPQIFK